MHRPSRGLHHVTAITGQARLALEFYAQVLGLKLIKKTVCYDDPGSYHLYHGDGVGRPGAFISTLSWQCVPRGMIGAGEAIQTAFRIPATSIGWWSARLQAAAIGHHVETSKFGEEMLCLADPDGTALALVGLAGIERETSCCADDVDAEHALRGLHGVTLRVREADLTVDILRDVLGFDRLSQAGDCIRFVAHDGPGGTITLRVIGRSARGRVGAGTIRHVAFRAADTDDQAAMAEQIREISGIVASEPIDRTYLRSISFHAPCGVLFEITTDGPGFTVDEAPENVGKALKLPGFLEARRPELQDLLSRLD